MENKKLADYVGPLVRDSDVKKAAKKRFASNPKLGKLIERLSTKTNHVEAIDIRSYDVDVFQLIEFLEDFLEESMSVCHVRSKSNNGQKEAFEIYRYKDLVYWLVEPGRGVLSYFGSLEDAMDSCQTENHDNLPE